MKFIVDAHISKSISTFLKEKGFDSIHTFELALGNDTEDKDISDLSIKENRIVITKDSDFYHSFILKQEPYKLILVKPGNISTKDLKVLFEKHFDSIIESLKDNFLIELDWHNINIVM